MPAKKSRWPELCQEVAQDDGLLTRPVGSWTADKLYWWHRYIEITTDAMVGKPQWSGGLVYVDLFAGPGVLQLDNGQRLPGSPLIAARSAKPFTRMLLCEMEEASAMACQERLRRIGAADCAHVFVGDCNLVVEELTALIPQRSLTLAFVDPTGLHARFETLRTLAAHRQVDLLILFADFMDIVRNVDQYARSTRSNLDGVLGPDSNWRDRWNALENRTAANISKLFVEVFRQQLQHHLGYSVFGDEVLRMPSGTPLYRVLYASKHPRGLDFWKKSVASERSGRRLF